MNEYEKIIAEFDWCDGDDQTIGAMASEIRHLRARIESLQGDIRKLNEIYNKKEW